MAKICSNCRNIIEDSCTTCPVCHEELGNNLNINRKHNNESSNVKSIFTTGFIIILIMLGATYAVKTFVYDKVTNDADDPNKLYNIKDTINCSNVAITINDMIIKPQGTEIDTFEGNYIQDPEWIGVIVTVKNLSKTEVNVTPSDFILNSTTGFELSPSMFTYDIWGDYSILESSKLKPESEITGYLQYKNKEDDNSSLMLKITCDNMFKKDTYTVLLPSN